MKRLFITILTGLVLTTSAYAVDRTVFLSWEQSCVDGCSDAGAVEGWNIYLSDTPGGYGDTPIIVMPYDGTATPTYSSSYVLTLTGAGTIYIVIRSFNSNSEPQESGKSNEVAIPYNFLGTKIPVNLTFTLSP